MKTIWEEKSLPSQNNIGKKQDRFFKDISEKVTEKSIEGKTVNQDKENSSAYEIHIRPQSIDANYESYNGFRLQSIIEDPVFQKLEKITNSVRKEFAINKINRSGFRVFFYDKLYGDSNITTDVIKDFFCDKFKKLIDHDNLGNVNDAGIVIEGRSGDSFHYIVRFGPYQEGESQAKKYFSLLKNGKDELSGYDIIMDIDFYQKNFNLFNTVKLSKWCTQAIEKADFVIEEIKNIFFEMKPSKDRG